MTGPVETDEESEFGQGFAYCLGLFLCHDERAIQHKGEEKKLSSGFCYASMWFNGAADHLFDLVLPPALPKKKKSEIYEWRDKCIERRLEECTWKDVAEAVQYAKGLLRYWDDFNTIPTKKGQCE